jgi:O-antigen/teichoic acid export membrane protein
MLSFFKKVLKVYNNQIFILILYNLTNVINFLFQLFSSKKLQPEEFSLFFSSVSLVAVILGPFVSLQLLFQKKYVDYNKKNKIDDQKNLLNFSFIFFLFLQLIFFFIFLFFLDYLQTKFKYNNSLFFYLLFFLNLSNFFSIIPISILYSQKKYKLVNIVLLVIDIARLLTFLLFVNYFSNKIYFMIILNILYSLGSTIVMLIYVNAKFSDLFFININKFYISLKKYIKKIVIFVLYSSFWPLIYQLDIIFIRIFFDSDISSSYIVISSLSKIVMIIPHALQSYIFNQINLGNKLFSRELALNYFFYFLITILTVLFIFLFLESFINIIYGSIFTKTIEAFPYIVFSFALISISSLLSHLLLIKNKFMFIIFLYITVILYIFLTFIFHDTFVQISQNLLFCSFILFVCILINLIYLNKNNNNNL